MKLIDSHCHLDQLSPEDLSVYLKAHDSQGVKWHLLAGVDPTSWKRQRQICERHPNIQRAAGIHPWVIGDQSDEVLNKWLDLLEIELPNCIALGEVGLDFLKSTPKERQLEAARRQLDLAVRYKKPIIGHVVKAHNEFLDLLKSYPTLIGIIHAFSSSLEVAQRYIDRGFVVGFGNAMIHPKRTKLIQNIPLSGVVFESDAPFNLVHVDDPHSSTAQRVLRHVAQVRGIGLDDLAEIATQNCQRTLGWPATI